MHTEIKTYFTVPSGKSELLYSSPEWVTIEFQLESAGPVAVGIRQDVAPVLSGKGILLPTTGDTTVKFAVPRGDRVYVAAEAINRVKVIIEPVPWLEELFNQTKSSAQGIKSLAGLLSAALRKRKSPKPKEPTCPPSLPIPDFGGIR